MNNIFDDKCNRKNTRSTKWLPVEANDDVLPVWIADMEFKLHPKVRMVLSERLDHGIFGYTEVNKESLNDLRNWYSERYRYEFNTDELLITTGVVQSLSASIRILSDELDKIIVLGPHYHPFVDKIQQNNRIAVVSHHILKNGRYVIDYDDLNSKIDDKCKVFIFCNPHNPTGTLYTEEEVKELARFCQKHSLKIISDEIHADFVYEDKVIYPIINCNDYTINNSISLLSPGKTFNAAGFKIGVALIKNQELRDKFDKEAIKVGIKSVNTFGYLLFENCYKYGSEWVNELLDYINGNRMYCYDYISKNMPQIMTCKSDATYLIWLDLSCLKYRSLELKEKLISEAKILPSMGYEFGDDYDQYIRVNIALCKQDLVEVMKRLHQFIEDNSWK